MAEYGAELPEGFALDEPEQKTYGAELPEGFTLDEPGQELKPIDPSQLGSAGTLFKRIGDVTKEGVKSGIHLARPTIEGLSSVAGATGGLALGAPAGPLAPVVAAAGAAGGYTAAKNVLDYLEDSVTLPPEVKTRPAMKQITNQLQDFKTGLTFEFGGPAAMKILSLAGRGVSGGFNKVKDLVRKNTPAMTEEQVSKRAAEIIQENRGHLAQYDKNLAESISVGDEVPGFKSTIGQKTGDPGLIKLQRGLESKSGVAAELDQVQQAENVEAIENFLTSKFQGGQTIGDVVSELATQKATLRAGAETAERTAKATEAAIPTETPQVTGKKITETIKEVQEPVKKLEKEYWDKVPNYEMAPANTETVFKELAAEPSTAQKIVKQHYENYKLRPKTIKGLQTAERELNDVIFDVNADKTAKRALGQIKTAINEDFRLLGEAAEKGDFATIKGKVVHPKQMQKKLAETEAKLLKEGVETAVAKPDIKAIEKRIQDENIPGMMRQVQEPIEQWENRMVKSYKTNFGDPPMLKAKEKAIVTHLKETKATLETQLAEAEPAKNAAIAYQNAKDFSKSQIHDRFRTGVMDELEMAGKFQGGKKLPAEKRPLKLMDVESADKFINAVGPEKAGNIMLRHYADDMANKVKYGDDGILNAPGLNNWLKKNEKVLERYGIKDQFTTAEKAHKSLQQARIAEADFSKSIAAKMLNSDPQNAVARAFEGGEGISGKNTGDIMRNLIKRVKGNKDAVKGLENGFKDFMYEQAKTTAKTLKGKDQLSKATLDKSLRKYAPAMAVLYKGQSDKIKALQTVRKALLIMNRTAKGVGGGPDTAEKMSAIASVIGSIAHIPGISYTLKLGKLGLGKLKNLNEKETSDFIAKLLYDPDLAKIIEKASRKKPPVKIIERELLNYMDRAKMEIIDRALATDEEK